MFMTTQRTAATAGRSSGGAHQRGPMAALTLGALGVVFGDIGTSPLYALQAVFGRYGLHLAITPRNVYGIISLVIWAITIIVSIKYICFIMRAGNKGEGGIMALVALIKNDKLPFYRRWLFIFLGLAGVALFYGDSTITPAISVLSAVEGLKTVSPGLDVWIMPITLALLAMLFWVQQYGTAVIGRLFGPVMLTWFGVIGLAGAWRVWEHPEAAQAVSPLAAVQFVQAEPLAAFAALGAVILAVTGAEALYADMGHFGREPIARAWFLAVFPALILCYTGQGAVILSQPLSGHTPFMALFPPALTIPVVLLATAATLVASQSVISGAFSLTRQAIQLGFLPRMRVVHTSVREIGQIYIPFINVLLFLIVTLLVVSFGSSARLAHAFGIAVSGTLAIDTILFLAVARQIWHRSVGYIAVAGLLFVGLDLLFVAANLSKIRLGGWFPILLSAGVFLVIHTWLRGQAIVTAERRAQEGPLQEFVDKVRVAKPPLLRVPGTAVYIGHHADLAPLALHAAVEKLHELHEKVVIVSVRITTAAHIPEDKRAVFSSLAYDDGICHLRLSYGFHDSPNVPRTLASLRGLDPELDFDPAEASYFISLSKVVPGRRHNLAGWRKHLYTMMARNALSTSDFYKLPIERTIEMRSLIEL
jgi:KUP system potassium uptake protein